MDNSNKSKDTNPIIEFRKRSQVTVPKNIVNHYNLKEGDKLEIIPEEDGFKVRPVAIIPKSQIWFWSDKWQKGEKEADKAIKDGRVSKEYNDIDDLMADLFDNEE